MFHVFSPTGWRTAVNNQTEAQALADEHRAQALKDGRDIEVKVFYMGREIYTAKHGSIEEIQRHKVKDEAEIKGA